jgi:hypothetical protein
MPGAALRGARGTLRLLLRGDVPPWGVRPGGAGSGRTPLAARRPISSLPAPLLAYRFSNMRAPLLAGALISGADRATFGRSSGASH